MVANQTAEAREQLGKEGTKPDWNQPDHLQWIDINLILPDPDNQRKAADLGNMKRLLENIKKRGIKDPLKIRRGARDDEVFVLGGHRRYEAAKRAGFKALRCMIHSGPLSQQERLRELLLDNLHREDLSPVDEGRGYRQIMEEENIDADTLAETMDLDIMVVKRRLAFLGLSADIQDQINQRRIPEAAAYSITKQPVVEHNELAALVVAGRLNGKGIDNRLTRKRLGSRRPLVSRGTGSSRVEAKTEKTFHAPGGTAVTIKSLTKKLTNEQIIEALKVVINELER